MSDLSKYRDPRGPERTAVKVEGHGIVTLSCGHVRQFNPIYMYRVGDKHRCFACTTDYREEAPHGR